MTAAERLAKQVKLSKELAEAHAHADRVLAQARAVASRRNGKVLSLPGKSPETKRAEHKASTGDLRSQAFARSEGKCEACGVELGKSWDLHHVEGGGSRRPRQRIFNVLCLCWECHRRAHRGDLGTLAQIARSIALDADARRAAEHRIDKLMEARASRAAGGTR